MQSAAPHASPVIPGEDVAADFIRGLRATATVPARQVTRPGAPGPGGGARSRRTCRRGRKGPTTGVRIRSREMRR
jgi:hypothetical protein